MMSTPLLRAPADSRFTVEVDNRADVFLIRAAGELDLNADPLLGATLARGTVGRLPIIADFTAVTFCASSTLDQLVTAGQRTPYRVTVIAHHRAVVRPLNLLGLDRYLIVVPDLDNALRVAA